MRIWQHAVGSCRALVSLVSLFSLHAFGEAPASTPQSPPASTHASATALPLTFERNEGQFDAGIAFVGHTGAYTVVAQPGQLRFVMPGRERRSVEVKLSLQGLAGKVEGLEETSFRTNRFSGADEKQWRTGIHNYGRIRFTGQQPGVASDFYAAGSTIEHDFLIAPGADASSIRMALTADAPAVLKNSGEIAIRGDEGEFTLRRPVAYQIAADGHRTEVSAHFDLQGTKAGSQKIGFRLGAYDHTRELVIDPVIIYSTFVGGPAGSTAGAVATDGAGNAYLAGIIDQDIPVTGITPTVKCVNGPCSTEIFVAKFGDAAGGSQSSWITYIAGTQNPSIPYIYAGVATTAVKAAAANGTTVVIGGYTYMTALPEGANSTNPTQGYSGFITSLDAGTGSLNGTRMVRIDANETNDASVQGLALDASGNVYAAGSAGHVLFGGSPFAPTPNAFPIAPAVTGYGLGTPEQPYNAFVLKLPLATINTAAPSFFTYIQQDTLLTGIGVDSFGRIYVSGHKSGSFLIPNNPNASMASNTGDINSFVLSFTPQTASTPPTVNGFTWVGGTGNTMSSGIAIDGTGNSYLFGNTNVNNLSLRVLGPFFCAITCFLPNSSGSGYVFAIDNNGLIFGFTYLGGSGSVDYVYAGGYSGTQIFAAGVTNAPDPGGANIPLAGVSTTQSSTAPFNTVALPYGQDTTTPGTVRSYVVAMQLDLTSVNYVANLGGSAAANGFARSIAVDSKARVFAAVNIPAATGPYTSASAFQATNPGGSMNSAYLAEIVGNETTTGLTIEPATATPTPATVTADSTVTFKWKLTAPSNAATSNLVVNIPSVSNLSFTSAGMTDVTAGETSIGACSSGTGGITCVVPSVPRTVPGTNDTLTLTLNGKTTSTVPDSVHSVSVTATAYSPASEYSSSSQTLGISAPSNLQVSMGTPSATSIYAGGAAQASLSSFKISYPITLTNAGSSPAVGEAPTASLSLSNFPSGFVVSSVSTITAGGASIGSCDTTATANGCTSVDLPAGASLTYTITGYYSNATLFPSTDNLADVSGGSFTASASGLNNTVSATPLATGVTVHTSSQKISFTQPVSPITYGSTSVISLDATASSGLTPTFTIVSGPGSISSGNLTMTGAGTIVIAANQPGNTIYAAAEEVQRTLVISKATPVITWTNPADITYGTALTATQLNATAAGPGGVSLPGTFT